MEWWKHRKPEELISECEAIQKRQKKDQSKPKNNQTRKLSVD